MAWIAPAIAGTFRSPVPEAYSWLEGMEFPQEFPLINVSQAAPTAPPPEGLRRAMADALLTNPNAHLYGPVLGNDDLRQAVADRWSQEHGAQIDRSGVAITSGCNQAFVATMATLTGPGDEVILPTPWYFNHKMWLDMAGAKVISLPCGPAMLPDPDQADKLISQNTRAICLVSPNNPTGVEYPAELIRAFYELAQRRGIALVLDETYRDFRGTQEAPHDLFKDPDWDQTLIQLYSFSKAYRLTGHRVGALTTSSERLDQVEKFLDTVTICPAQTGQIGALWGMQNLQDWLEGERQEVMRRNQAVIDGFPSLAEQGWELLGRGAFFAYLKAPDALLRGDLCRHILEKVHLLALPGSMFSPPEDVSANLLMRTAFANLDSDGIRTMFERLKSLSA